MNAPPIIWIDERIAAGLPQGKDPELAERGVDQIRYIAHDRVTEMVSAARGGDEFICNISAQGRLLYGLSNYGRLFIFLKPEDHIGGEWALLAERELQSLETTDPAGT